METKQWYDLWDAYFKKLSKRDVQIWEDELAEKFNSNLPEDEIIGAVKKLAEQKRRGLLEYMPNCNHLITEIIKGRYEAKKSISGESDNKCSLCRGGLLVYFADSITNEIGIKENGCYEYAVPCLCSVGQNLLRKQYPNEIEQDRLRSLAQKVKEWICSITEYNDSDDLRFAPKQEKRGVASVKE